MTTPYLDVAGFRAATLMPGAYVDDLESLEPGWLLGRLTFWSAWLNARLAKRYAAPFATPYPETITNWLAQIVTHEGYLKHGIDATDAQFVEVKALAERARAEVQEAADSEKGLFELPLRADLTGNGVTRGGPLGYAEASPWTWTTLQREAAEGE